MKKNVEEKKMTLEEYEEKYSKPQNVKLTKTLLYSFMSGVGIVVGACLFLVVLKIYDINLYAGYIATAVAVIIFIFAYLRPILKIINTKYFITNVDSSNARKAQKHNKMLREEIADKMIDLKAKTEGVGFYSDELIGKLAIARTTKNDKELKNVLTNIYNKDVKPACNKMINEYALKVGFTTAISQSERLDSLFVSVYELQLIKNIVFMYGYRPSDAKLLKIYRTVIVNSLTAYGVNTATKGFGAGVVKTLGKGIEGIPILGQAIGTVIDSTIQGIVNASLTVVIGFQTKKYLMKEYKLQDILDGVEVSEEAEIEEEKEMLEKVSGELKAQAKNKNKKLEPEMI